MNYSGKERRRDKRGDVYVKVFSINHDSVRAAYTDNISASGLRAVFDEELAASSVLNLEIFLHDSNQEPVICKGKVVWTKKIENPQHPGVALYDTGIEFLP